jgi:hypothetical protein
MAILGGRVRKEPHGTVAIATAERGTSFTASFRLSEPR